ncbi:hypothetical protein [Bradyrhizobium erythrophlei]|uniref:Tail assembly chaperone n=1 Tax=Bradyrhizobium erythrophlei TaxID=1437360 RepID=A0A1H4NVU5_9BRAD|nr:hypothetical protein [Bradyrhizobium erythrophlei]SEB99301.1 hypothetical protein SAMN05444164_0746 [Bradyrhizobium erythrophlei]
MTETPKKKLKLSSMKVDLDKEREGSWEPALDIDPDISWFVRSTNYGPFKTARDAVQIRLSRKHGNNVPDDVLAEEYGKLAVQHLLLGWEGLAEDDEITDIPYSPEKARDILTDPAYRLIRGSIYMAASRVGIGEAEFVGAGAKN